MNVHAVPSTPRPGGEVVPFPRGNPGDAGPCDLCRARVESRRDHADLVVHTGGGGRRELEAALAADPAGLLRHAERILGSHDLAWDAVQDAYLSLWLAPEVPADPRRWLLRTVHHRSLHARRTLSRRASHEARGGEWREARVTVAEPSHALEAADEVERVRTAVAGLPEPLRAAFALHADGADYATIATALGVPVGTVRSRLHRARARLEAALA